MPDAMLGRRRQSGPIVAEIVDVGAAADDTGIEPGRQFVDARVEFALAVIAAAAVVADIVGTLELTRRHDPVLDADPLGELLGVIDLGARHARAVGGDGDRPVAECAMSRCRHDAAVDAAAERDEHALAAAENVEQAIGLGGEVVHESMVRRDGAGRLREGSVGWYARRLACHGHGFAWP